VVFFHGGGFRLATSRVVPGWLVYEVPGPRGSRVASANYRLSQMAPFPARGATALGDPVPSPPGEGVRDRLDSHRGVR